MSWENIHIFLDIAATCGSIAVGITTFLFRAAMKDVTHEIDIKILKLESSVKEYEATCSAERKELYRMVDNFTND